MTQETLKKLRLLIPGVMWWVALRPLFSDHVSLESVGKLLSASGLLNLTAAVILGVVYEILDARTFVWRKPLGRVNRNIKDRLLSACPGTTSEDDVEKLRQGRKLMHLFYRFVDNDPSLEEKAKRVRFNGLIWTSLVDLSTISLLSALVYLVAAAATQRLDLATVGVSLLVIWAITQWLLLPMTTKKHLKLSTEQLEVIEQYHRKDLCEEIGRLAKETG